jgi:hypothetical protein
LKFFLAGKNAWYPGFNGQFHKVNYRTGPGAFIDTVDQFNAFLKDQGDHIPLLRDTLLTIR